MGVVSIAQETLRKYSSHWPSKGHDLEVSLPDSRPVIDKVTKFLELHYCSPRKLIHKAC